jgi:hypothetical protein
LNANLLIRGKGFPGQRTVDDTRDSGLAKTDERSHFPTLQ